MTDPRKSAVVATTYSRNESGVLWERLWLLDDEGPRSQFVCSGVFVGPKHYGDEDEFWSAFESEREQGGGHRHA